MTPSQAPNRKDGEEKEKRIWDYRLPPKPPFIQNGDEKGIRVPEKKCLLDTEPNYRSPPEPPPKVCGIVMVPRTR